VVAEGDKLHVEKLGRRERQGARHRGRLFVGGDSPKVGAPRVGGASVTATIVEQGREKKVYSMRRKRRKGYHKIRGHRQYFTELEIQENLRSVTR